MSPQPEDKADLDFVVLILSALSPLDLLQCFTTRHTVDSHFQGHKKTELVIIHALSHSKQTGKRFHCLQYLIHYKHIPVVAGSLFFYFYFRPSREMYICYGLELELMLFSGADYLLLVLWRCMPLMR